MRGHYSSKVAMAMILGIPIPSQSSRPPHSPPFPSPARIGPYSTLPYDEDHSTLPGGGGRTSRTSSLRPPHKNNIPELPPHWRDEFSAPGWLQPVLKKTFSMLCMIAVGHRTLWNKWKALWSEEEVFMKNKEMISNRIAMTSVVVRRADASALELHRRRRALTHLTQASLLLASNAALVTTEPPEAGILNYTIRGPYLCLWTSFGILLGGTIVAAANVYVLATCYPEWVVQVRLPDKAQPTVNAGLNTSLSTGLDGDARARVVCAHPARVPVFLHRRRRDHRRLLCVFLSAHLRPLSAHQHPRHASRAIHPAVSENWSTHLCRVAQACSRPRGCQRTGSCRSPLCSSCSSRRRSLGCSYRYRVGRRGRAWTEEARTTKRAHRPHRRAQSLRD